jgi:hypothetical protein
MTVLLILSRNWNENDLDGIQYRCCPKTLEKRFLITLSAPRPAMCLLLLLPQGWKVDVDPVTLL